MRDLKEFLTLEEFLSLKEHDNEYFRFHHMELHKYVAYYKCAKANWERFGNSGPPPGAEVITLRDGFGGGEGLKGIVGNSCNHNDSGDKFDYFELKREDRSSLVNRDIWWVLISTEDLCPFDLWYGWSRLK